MKQLKIIELDLSECELLGEIKQVLLENAYLKLTPNIQFTHNNKTLNQFEPISGQINTEA